MQRAVLTFLLITILLAGCSTPATPQDILSQAITLTPPHTNPPTDVLQQTATFTPAPLGPPIDILQQAVTFTPPLAGSLVLEHQSVARIMLDESYIYWGIDGQENVIFRAPLDEDGAKVEDFVISKFKDGNVLVFPLTRAGDWFVYLDHDNSGAEPNWELRAKNLQDDSEKVILSGRGTYAAAFNLFISASGEWIAWSHLVSNTQETCQESVLGLSNLNTNEQIELNRTCIEQYMWTFVGLSNETLVAEQDLPDAKGGGSNLYLFDDVLNKQYNPLLIDENASTPDISSPWIVWKNAPRFDWGNSNSVYNTSDKTQRVFIAPGGYPTDPQLAGHWLYWLSDDGASVHNIIYFYDLKSEQAWKMHPPIDGVFSDTAIYGQWIAWSRRGEYASSDSVLEWGKLP